MNSAGLLDLLALAVAILICVKARSFGERLKVMAYPDGVRKRHKNAVPQIGGVAILSALSVWLLGAIALGDGTSKVFLIAMLLCMAGVGLIGFTDDQHNTSPLSRILFMTVFLCVAAVFEPGLITRHLHWASFENGDIPIWLYCALAGTAVIGLVNAVNMADGQDGIVGSMFVIWAGCLLLVTQGPQQEMAALVLGSSLIFLAFNLGGRLFLGDCGAYGVTFVFAMLAIGAHAQGHVSIETIVVWFFIPVIDCLRLLISRPLRGRSPFDGDCDHFHHRLEDKLGKQFGLLAYAGMVGFSSLAATLYPTFALQCLVILSAFYFSFAWQSGAAEEVHGHGRGEMGATNVVFIGGEQKSAAAPSKD